MDVSEHLTDRAGYLAALPEDDPERVLAEEHARNCSACRDALREGLRLMDLLRRALSAAHRIDPDPFGRSRRGKGRAG